MFNREEKHLTTKGTKNTKACRIDRGARFFWIPAFAGMTPHLCSLPQAPALPPFQRGWPPKADGGLLGVSAKLTELCFSQGARGK